MNSPFNNSCREAFRLPLSLYDGVEFGKENDTFCYTRYTVEVHVVLNGIPKVKVTTHTYLALEMNVIDVMYRV